MVDSSLVSSWRRLCFTSALFFIAATSGAKVAVADSAGDWARMKGITPNGYVCYRAEATPVVDGKLDDACWDDATWTNDFVDIEGAAKPLPRFRTRAKMLWDDEFFYIAALMEAPHVWGTLTKHDSVIFHDNDFEVFIDPNGDNHEYYEFEMNALNTGWDLFLPRPYKDGGSADNGWEIPGLKTAVHIDGTLNDPSDEDKQWSVEIAIPWRVLREFAHRPSPPHDGDQWRVNFSRVEWQHEIVGGKYKKVPKTREDNWVWSPQGIIDMHRPERWGFVQFSKAKPGSIEFEHDADWKARERLMTVYHHQKAFHQKHKRWSDNRGELHLKDGLADVRMSKTADGFEAVIAVQQSHARYHIRQDSRLWKTSMTDDLSIAIKAILTKQANAWNGGDIDEFMEHYWKSDKLTFSSGGKTTRGWQTTKDNYKERYPTRERMGKLSFAELEVTALSNEAALVLGRWHLEREPEPIGGNFSLVFRRIDDRWLIVHDHTSVAEAKD